MPVLARMVASPLSVDIRRGAVDDLAGAARTSATSPHRQRAGRRRPLPGRGDLAPHRAVAARGRRVFDGRGRPASRSPASSRRRCGERGYDAVVGIGGGRTLDVAKYAATRVGLPMVAVATNLAHDGLCSPVASLEHPHGKGSYGVPCPLAVVVDLDYVRAAPVGLVRCGHRRRRVATCPRSTTGSSPSASGGEPVDGLAIDVRAHRGGAILHRDDTVADDEFLVALAEALVLSGIAMSVAGTSRPCSGACHEIIHAVDALYPGVVQPRRARRHRGPVRRASCAGTRRRVDLDRPAALARHGLPRTPAEIGLTDEQFVAAVLAAPDTRPDRYTILEHLDLDEAATTRAVADYLAAVAAL